MGFQSRLTSIDIKKGCIQQIFVRLGRAIFNYDIFQFCQLLPYLIMMLIERTDLVVFRSIPLNQ